MLDAPLYDGPRAQTTLERWHQIHGLLDQGVGLLECARRLQLALNTVKRYARAEKPERMLRVPKYRASLVDPYRDHLRKRRTKDPAVPVLHPFEEIKALGFTGCLNLLHKYINPHAPLPRGRRGVQGERPARGAVAVWESVALHRSKVGLGGSGWPVLTHRRPTRRDHGRQETRLLNGVPVATSENPPPADDGGPEANSKGDPEESSTEVADPSVGLGFNDRKWGMGQKLMVDGGVEDTDVSPTPPSGRKPAPATRPDEGGDDETPQR